MQILWHSPLLTGPFGPAQVSQLRSNFKSVRIAKITPTLKRHALLAGTGIFAVVASTTIMAGPALAGPTISAGVLPRGPEVVHAKIVTFTGHYNGHATLLINNGAVSIPSVRGSGKGTLVGASTIEGRGSASASAQCDPFSGTGSISGAHGKLELVVTSSTSSGCSSGESGPVSVAFHGVAVVKSGTGPLAGASGSWKFKGNLKIGGTSGSQNGPYSVSLSGKLDLRR